MNAQEKLRRGIALFDQGRHAETAGRHADAARFYAQANLLLPDHPPLLVARATLAERTRDWPAAEHCWRHLGALRPDSNFEGRLAAALFRLERYADALPYFATHVARHPDDDSLLLPFALALVKGQRWEQALPIGQRLLAQRRDATVVELVLNCLLNLGHRGEFDAMLEASLRDFPDNPLILALCGMHLLKSRDYQRGFGLQPAIRRRYMSHKPGMDQPMAGGWDGKPFDGVLLIDAEQGLGEEILAASMFHELIERRQRAVISCDPRLVPLFARAFPELSFVSRYDGELDRLERSEKRFIRFYEIDLACLFRRDPFQHTRPWLVPDAARVEQLIARYDQRFPGMRRKAISWRTAREQPGAPRSIRLPELLPLFQIDDFAWFNVQYGDYSRDIAELSACGVETPWDDLSIDQTKDLDGLAAQLCALDGLVSISNTTVHLAGALGVPSHLILPKSRPVIWYWGYDGDRTPWYPSISIVRNRYEDNWDELGRQLADRLRERHHPNPEKP